MRSFSSWGIATAGCSLSYADIGFLLLLSPGHIFNNEKPHNYIALLLSWFRYVQAFPEFKIKQFPNQETPDTSWLDALQKPGSFF